MTSPFDFSGPSKLAKELTTGLRRRSAATKKTEKLRAGGVDPSQIYGISHAGDERVTEFRKRNKK